VRVILRLDDEITHHWERRGFPQNGYRRQACAPTRLSSA
jgi:hypothetical protein